MFAIRLTETMNKFLISACVVYIVTIFACTHDPVYLAPDTSNLDGTEDCNPDIIYYEKDIQPILNSSCAYVGCHDSKTAAHHIDLSSFAKSIEEVSPGKLSDSELYEVIITSNPGKRMPPSGKLPAELIAPIEKWILQGAQNITCINNTACTTSETPYSNGVKSIMTTYCYGCHSGSNPIGKIKLDSYSSVKASANNGSLYGSVSWLQGYSKMPEGLPKLDTCTINKIKNWVDNGAQDN